MKKSLIIFIASVLITIPLAVLEAYALSLLWRWYLMPYFGMKQVPYVAFFGLSIFVGLIAKHLPINDKSAEENLLRGAFISITKSLVAIFFGWLFLAIFA